MAEYSEKQLAWMARVDAEFSGLKAGPCSLPEDHEDYSPDEWFTWRWCEGCGGLAGNRQTWIALDRDGRELTYDLCQDCRLYVANGDVPDDEYID